MSGLLCYLRADFKKTKGLSIRAAHIAIPVAASAVFLVCYMYSSWESHVKIEAYFQVLGIGFPFLISVFCAMLAEQELFAGAYQNLLSVPKRPAVFFSKWLLLVLSGAGAVLLASVLFGAGFSLLPGEQNVSGAFYPAAALILLCGNLFLYVLHLFLALCMNKGVTLGAGIVESLLSALLLTGMGEGVWFFVPPAWGPRLVTVLLRACDMPAGYAAGGHATGGPVYGAAFLQKFNAYVMIDTDCRTALLTCAALTVGALAAFLLWARRWDGVRGNE